MGFLDWISGKDQGGGSDSFSSSNDSNYDINYDELDRNDSYSPYQDVAESGEAYKQYQDAYSDYQTAKNSFNDNSGWIDTTWGYDDAKNTVNQYQQAYEDAYNNWQNTINSQEYNAPSNNTNYLYTPNPNKPYENDYQYATPDDLRALDHNDSYNPFFLNNGETAYFKGNQGTPVDP